MESLWSRKGCTTVVYRRLRDSGRRVGFKLPDHYEMRSALETRAVQPLPSRDDSPSASPPMSVRQTSAQKEDRKTTGRSRSRLGLALASIMCPEPRLWP